MFFFPSFLRLFFSFFFSFWLAGMPLNGLGLGLAPESMDVRGFPVPSRSTDGFGSPCLRGTDTGMITRDPRVLPD